MGLKRREGDAARKEKVETGAKYCRKKNNARNMGEGDEEKEKPAPVQLPFGLDPKKLAKGSKASITGDKIKGFQIGSQVTRHGRAGCIPGIWWWSGGLSELRGACACAGEIQVPEAQGGARGQEARRRAGSGAFRFFVLTVTLLLFPPSGRLTAPIDSRYGIRQAKVFEDFVASFEGDGRDTRKKVRLFALELR